MSEMTFHLCDYCAKTERMRKLLAIVRAATELSEDEESQEGGWGPDVTMLIPLRKALAAWEEYVEEER